MTLCLRKRVVSAALVAASTSWPALAQSPAAACRVAVSVRDSAGAALHDAAIIIGTETARTDSSGIARMTVGSTTPVVARVRRLGFAAGRVMLFPVCDLPPALTDVRLTAISTRINTVTVSAKRAYAGPLAGFYERRARGDGVYFTHADFVRINAQRLSDVLRTVNGIGEMGMRPNSTLSTTGLGARATTRRVPERCYPLLVIDGMAQSTIGEISTEQFDPRGLAGVEVYPDASRTPPEFLQIGNGSRCGTIVIWSRRSDTYLPEPHVGRNDMVPDSLIYDAADVDELAQLDTARSVTPVYPTALRRKALDGEVSVELVVASDGRPVPRNARVLSATHRSFGDAVLDGLPLFTFEPARRNEQPVAQRVRLTVAFKATPP